MTSPQLEPKDMLSQSAGRTSGSSARPLEPPSTAGVVLHLVVMSHQTGDESVLLIEREPGVVEFPAFEIDPLAAEDEAVVAARAAAVLGFDVAIEGFIGAHESVQSSTDRFLLVRTSGGTPHFAVAPVGWEWRPAASLLSRPFVPRPMANDFRSPLNC